MKSIEVHGFDPDERVVGVYPKERELKISARMFGLLTLQKRLYVVLTEAMLADHIFEYFPEITMTFDSVTLQSRIHENTKNLGSNQRGRYSTSVIVNMDFNKWNSYMRKEETLELFEDFDKLFGMKDVFTRTHEMFDKSIMYLADGNVTPLDDQGNPIDDPAVWTGHLGGIEGLRQKGWTIFTVVLLKYIAEVNEVHCQIMGQGDNQVLIVQYVNEDERPLRNRHERFLEALDNYLTGIGPPLKLEETWSSSLFFI